MQAVVVHDQVDAVAGQHGGQCVAPDILIGFGNLEQLQILQHVMHDLVQIGAELDRILDLLLQSGADLLKFVIQQRLHDLPPQGRKRLVHHTLHRPGLVEIAGDLRAQFLFGLSDPGAAFLGQRKHFVLGIGAPLFSQQREQYVAGFAMHRETARFGVGLEFGVGLGFFRLVRLLDARTVCSEILPVQSQRYFRLQRFRHLRHQLFQQTPLPGRQAQGAGSFRRIEVVQIAQVGRDRLAGGG